MGLKEIVAGILLTGSMVFAQGIVAARITKTSGGAVEGIKIEASVENAKNYWLAYSVLPQDDLSKAYYGEEIDFYPVQINTNSTKRLEFGFVPLVVGDYSATVALWARKVTKDECSERNGSPCGYCNKNGFHMENEADRENLRTVTLNSNF